MKITVGTFNLNNLFSRFNFSATINEINRGGNTGSMTIKYSFANSDDYKIKTYMGKLIKAKDPKDTKKIAERIKFIDVDILAVQEVEDIGILREFNRTHLNGMYPYQILIEGNDIRFIDIGLLSKYPVGSITSFQTLVHNDAPDNPVFSRDLVEISIMDDSRSETLFYIYNNHLKSHFGDEDNGGAGKDKNDTRRRRQAEMISNIISQRMKADSRYIITGDMNDPPIAAPIKPMLTINGNKLFNALQNPTETRPPKAEKDGHDPTTTAWTHRFKKSGQPPTHELFDHIWLSPALKPAFKESFIDRRTKHGGDGSDHDPAWIELNL